MLVNETMKNQYKIMGLSAPAPRMTRAAAFLLATALSVPVFILLNGIAWLLG
ncbi:hypothetical protein [Parasedimentitalea psychrophila]|uniref:Uncharacterized protein n=1 Tax=Parasedimentitalea psychrophila TaxID=2997337 RepID=A0A9Y2L042_9RHOB|nr:hypothetical protein [Parasedimentitalea psychrophila]WIY25221.1 hypothetical protein QPJ95_22520 [Parasedimentitalea psychrophila]